jgi:hypothetical protein
MPVTKLPDMIACTDAVLPSADAEPEDAFADVTLRTDQGDRHTLPLSEQAITRMLEIISECHRMTDVLGQKEDPELNYPSIAVGKRAVERTLGRGEPAELGTGLAEAI